MLSSDMEQTVMVEQTTNPNWNQQVLVHNPRHAPESDKGFFVIQLRDFHREAAYDTLYLPMGCFKPLKGRGGCAPMGFFKPRKEFWVAS